MEKNEHCYRKDKEPNKLSSNSWNVFFDEAVVELAAKLIPSNRGELEITDLNNLYLRSGQLHEIKLSRGTAWFDLGTIDNLQAATEFVKAVQASQGIIIGSPLEAREVMLHEALS